MTAIGIYGSAGRMGRAITDAIAGAEVGFIPHDAARHAIVIRMNEALRADPAAILALPLRVGDYGMVPLSRVALAPRAPVPSARTMPMPVARAPVPSPRTKAMKSPVGDQAGAP